MKKYAGILFAALLMAGSCGKQTQEASVDIRPEHTPTPGLEMAAGIERVDTVDINQVYNQVDQLMQAGQTDNAIRVMSQALDTCSSNRKQLFTRLLDMLLTADNADYAREVCMKAIGQEMELTQASFEIFYRCYKPREDPMALETGMFMLDDAFDTYNANRAWLFTRLLDILLDSDNVDHARDRYFTVIERDMELTRAGFGTIYRYYQGRGDADALVEWTKTLVNAPLPDDLSERAFGWYLQACRAKGPFNQVLVLVPVCVKQFDGAASRRILNDLMQSLFKGKEYDHAGRLLGSIEKESGTSPDLRELAAVLQTDLLFLQERWSKAEKQFIKAAPSLQDGELRSCLARAASPCIQKEQYDLVDRLCDFVLRTQKDKNAARQEAARQWLAVATEQKHIADIPARLQVLQQLNLQTNVLLSLYDNQFYFVVEHGTQDDLVQMLRFGRQLFPWVKTDEDIGRVRILDLDGTFVLEDYEGALKILEKGVPDREEDWHKAAFSKISAHLALQRGKKKEAIKRFREFMEWVSGWEYDERDPITGMMHSKEMILGLNDKRIGDILDSMGDAKASRAAYHKAEKYYLTALKEIKPDTKRYEYVQAQLKSIPLQKKNP